MSSTNPPPIPLTPETSSILTSTITHTDSSKIRSTLQKICDQIPDAKKLAVQDLLVTLDNPQKTDSGSSDITSRYETCKNCKETFDVLENGDGECCYHSGEKEVDDESSTWDDFPDDGPDQDEYVDDEEFAGGFLWSCCEKRLGERGCCVGKHEARREVREENGRKRRRCS